MARPLHQCMITIFVVTVIVRGQWIIDYDAEDVDEDGDYNIDEGELFTFDYDDDKEEKPCSPPSSIRNGDTHVWGGGLLLEYQCNNDYNAVGPTHGACDLSTGQWTIDPPLCVVSETHRYSV
nr:hypothetical protein BaRGS_017993 [Batillaria attramentaria]